MKVRFTLFGRLLLWLALNLVLITVLFAALPGRTGSGWGVLLSAPVRVRLVGIAADISKDLSQADESRWHEVLAHYGALYGVTFSANVVRPPGPPPPDRGPGGEPHGERSPRAHPPPAALVSVSHRPFGAYEIFIPAFLDRPGRHNPLDITASARDLPAFLHFLGDTEWVLFAGLVIVLSVALWWPFMLSITRTIERLTQATQRIAEGHFDVRVPARRRDELGQLAESINRMAGRLESHLAGQKQFIADIAHEITSPLARMQLSLGLLESRLDGSASGPLSNLQEEAEHMAELLNELLLFSRAEARSVQTKPQRVALRSVVTTAVQREHSEQRVSIDIAADLEVMAYPQLLLRALSNLVRNARRYAEDAASPIEITAAVVGIVIQVAVCDRGPGVPEADLVKLGEPFFRPEPSRSRDTGGFGLGLAIVRRCIAACGGEVRFRNREGGGFEAEIQLEAAM